MDWEQILYGPVWEKYGEDALLYVEPGHPPVTVQAIDKTLGVEITEGEGRLLTLRAAAVLLLSELDEKKIPLSSLNDATLVMNGKYWRCIAKYPRPAPIHNDETVGQVYLELVRGEAP